MLNQLHEKKNIHTNNRPRICRHDDTEVSEICGKKCDKQHGKNFSDCTIDMAGNDGLNTVVPFENDLYYKARPKIAIQKKRY